MTLSSYRDLIAWQKAIELVEIVYQATARFPRCEIWGLSNQLRRAAVSIPSNIAEGQGRRSTRDFLKFLAIAQGSRQEVETQIIIAERLGYLEAGDSQRLLEQIRELGRVISGLSKSLEARLPDPHAS
ncbi:MAG TPA: four helix bundle protein [Gemmataceae bacterium]|jgi:four helix bundle protein|nr:four helix bundle protein [Gemmataceae bacterium]